MGTVAVTGGAGFIGTNLVRELIKSNFEVVVLDDFSTGLRQNLLGLDCSILDISITEYPRVVKALESCEYIFHLAARGSVPRSIINPIATMQVNAIGTQNVLEAAKATGAWVAFASSSSVYGSNTTLPKSENMWTGPITPYAASKLSSEALIQSYSHSYGVKAVNFRLFNVFGPWQRPDHQYAAVLPKWIWKALRQEEIEVHGGGNQSRDFTFVGTVVSVLVQSMMRKLNHPSPINLALGSRISLNEVLIHLKIIFPNLKISYRPEREGDIRDSQSDPALLKRIFPDLESSTFLNALELTVAWYRSHNQFFDNNLKIES